MSSEIRLLVRDADNLADLERHLPQRRTLPHPHEAIT